MKILIGIPCMDKIPIETIASLQALKKTDDCEIQYVSNSLVYDARNQLAQEAMSRGFDYLLFIDSDMVFPADVLTRLIADKKDIVSGVYYARKGNHFPVIFSKVRPKTLFRKQIAEKFFTVPEGIFEIKGCGMGMCLIKVSALRKIFDRYKEPFRPLKLLGEDLSFCYRATKRGFKIYADANVELGHVGTKIYGRKDYGYRKM